MNIKSLCVAKQPRKIVWLTLRDRLSELASLIPDIESVEVRSREEVSNGVIQLVNHWTARPALPDIIKRHIPASAFTWIDRAEWRSKTFECQWSVEPEFMAERIRCAGVTRYEPALGGNGTRITFEGTFDLDARGLRGIPPILQRTVASAIEAVMTTMIPSNFRKLVDAASKLLASPQSLIQNSPRPKEGGLTPKMTEEP